MRFFGLRDEIFDEKDEILFVIDFDCPEGDKTLQKRPFKMRKYIKEKNSQFGNLSIPRYQRRTYIMKS